MLEKTKEPGYFNEFDKHCNKVVVQYYYLKMFLNFILSVNLSFHQKLLENMKVQLKKDIGLIFPVASNMMQWLKKSIQFKESDMVIAILT